MCVDLENVTHGEVNQIEKDENYMINYMWNLKEVIPVNPRTKQEQTCRLGNKLPQGRRSEGQMRSMGRTGTNRCAQINRHQGDGVAPEVIVKIL